MRAILIKRILCCVFIGLSFGDENKCCEKPFTIVRLVYPLRPSLTTSNKVALIRNALYLVAGYGPACFMVLVMVVLGLRFGYGYLNHNLTITLKLK